MSGLDELNRIIRNSKIIPQNQKQEYESKIQANPVMDLLNNIFYGDKKNEQTNNKK
ncbi:MAG TPA: hypothetical protein PKL30_19195 [Leptospiraceae bacterium]|nr:hypothetical protein [Leptospiraceae bacterium]HNF57469.1 hypothetical protein [Leptospiraceae bacterium]HNH57880.1 hypothetical protein [Leptospiraceae bacterium]HNN81025.1 hypothetical protein [Leptospiraceae bacterium]